MLQQVAVFELQERRVKILGEEVLAALEFLHPDQVLDLEVLQHLPVEQILAKLGSFFESLVGVDGSEQLCKPLYLGDWSGADSVCDLSDALQVGFVVELGQIDEPEERRLDFVQRDGASLLIEFLKAVLESIRVQELLSCLGLFFLLLQCLNFVAQTA